MKPASVVVGLSVVFAVTRFQTKACNDVENNSPLLQLKRHIFCDYDHMVRPVLHHSNVTIIRFGLIPIRVDYGEFDNVLDIHCWTLLRWWDAFITWDPKDFDGIKSIHVKSDHIWVPDVVVHNAGDDNVQLRMPTTDCWISHAGEVKCVPVSRYKSLCLSDHTWWPYEIYNCSLNFRSWLHSGDEIQFELMNGGLFLKGGGLLTGNQQNNEWDVVKSYVTNHTELFKLDDSMTQSVVVHFILKTHSGMIYVVYVIPAIVLMVMTLITVWLDPKSVERGIIANLNFIAHLLCIFDLDLKVPRNGENIPNLYKFYHESLALAAFTLILTSLLRHLQDISSAVPIWLSSVTSQILSTRFGQILLLSILDPKMSAGLEMNADDNTDLVDPKKKESAWKYVVILIGWIAFFAVLLAYTIMLCTILPTDTSMSFNGLDNEK